MHGHFSKSTGNLPDERTRRDTPASFSAESRQGSGENRKIPVFGLTSPTPVDQFLYQPVPHHMVHLNRTAGDLPVRDGIGYSLISP